MHPAAAAVFRHGGVDTTTLHVLHVLGSHLHTLLRLPSDKSGHLAHKLYALWIGLRAADVPAVDVRALVVGLVVIGLSLAAALLLAAFVTLEFTRWRLLHRLDDAAAAAGRAASDRASAARGLGVRGVGVVGCVGAFGMAVLCVALTAFGEGRRADENGHALAAAALLIDGVLDVMTFVGSQLMVLLTFVEIEVSELPGSMKTAWMNSVLYNFSMRVLRVGARVETPGLRREALEWILLVVLSLVRTAFVVRYSSKAVERFERAIEREDRTVTV